MILVLLFMKYDRFCVYFYTLFGLTKDEIHYISEYTKTKTTRGLDRAIYFLLWV